MEKTVDKNFMDYGIRTSDMEIIHRVCQEVDVDLSPEWVSEDILAPYNAGGNEQGIVEDKTIKSILKAALKKIK